MVPAWLSAWDGGVVIVIHEGIVLLKVALAGGEAPLAEGERGAGRGHPTNAVVLLGVTVSRSEAHV